jgi:hypothetical protein
MTVEMLITIPVDKMDLDSACNQLAEFIHKNFDIDASIIISAQILQKKVVIRTNGTRHDVK